MSVSESAIILFPLMFPTWRPTEEDMNDYFRENASF